MPTSFPTFSLPLPPGATPKTIEPHLLAMETAADDAEQMIGELEAALSAAVRYVETAHLGPDAMLASAIALQVSVAQPLMESHPCLNMAYWASADDFLLALIPLGQVLREWEESSRRMQALKLRYDDVLNTLDQMALEAVQAEHCRRNRVTPAALR